MSQSREPSAGIFQLPTDFDKKTLSANWVQKGAAVDAAKMPVPIIGTNYGAEGYQVWQYPKGHKLAGRPCEVATKGGSYILMFRPLTVTQQVNAIYGNVSKRHLIQEQSGRTIAGQPIIDPGMLSDERIRKATGIKEFGGDDEFSVEMNLVQNTNRVEAQPAAMAEA